MERYVCSKCGNDKSKIDVMAKVDGKWYCKACFDELKLPKNRIVEVKIFISLVV